MRLAVIDMGTNTFHLLVVEVKEHGSFQTIYREKTAVRIGKNGINQGFITEDASNRALAALKNFKEEIEKHAVHSVHATATSAIRNAKNGKDLIQKIKKITGIEARIISGLEEADYIYYGVTHALSLDEENSLIMDIGGGSIEFIIANNDRQLWKQSFEIGGQRMVEKFHKSDPISAGQISDLENYLTKNLSELFDACAIHLPSVLIGSSGTFDTLSEMYCELHGLPPREESSELLFDIKSFEEIYQNLVSRTREERLKIPGMIPMRVDMIVVAAVLVKFIVDSLDIRKMRVSAFALKEGVLLNTIHSFTKNPEFK